MVTLTCRLLFSLLGRLTQILESDPADCQNPSQLCPSPATSESTFSSIPSESPDTFSNLHSSLVPPNLTQSPPGSPLGSVENLSPDPPSPTMADKKRRAPLPPSYSVQWNQTGNHDPVREIHNPAYVDGSQPGKKMSLPLPDYETLFPQKRHGVQGHTRWDHIIAEVNERHRVPPPELLGPEVSVDDPEEHGSSLRSSVSQESPALRHYQTQPQETKPVPPKKAPAPAPPKSIAPPLSRSVADYSPKQSQNDAYQSIMRPNLSTAPEPVTTDALSRETPSARSRDGARKVLKPSTSPRPTSKVDWETPSPDEQTEVPVSLKKEAPTAKPRQRAGGKEPAMQEDIAEKHLSNGIQTVPGLITSSIDKKGKQTEENFPEFDPFPSTDLLSKDPWAQLKQNQEVNDLFTGSVQKEQRLEDRGMTADDLENIFNQDRPTDLFAKFNESSSNKHSEHREKDEESQQAGPAFQRRNSQRRSQTRYTTHSDNKTVKSQQEPTYKEETPIATINQGTNESVTPELQSHMKTPSRLYGGEDLFGAEPFTVTSALTSSEHLQVVMEEPESQAGGFSGGKMPLKAWVSPSEGQPVSAQSSSGGGLALSQRR